MISFGAPYIGEVSNGQMELSKEPIVNDKAQIFHETDVD
jgi:hypothetical protein